jgi:hypothetical protein
MALKIDPLVLNGSNYLVWDSYMETLLKSKGVWKYTKVAIPDPIDALEKKFIDGKKEKVLGVITTYTS